MSDGKDYQSSAAAAADTSVNSELQHQQQKVTVAYTNQPCRRKLQFINGKFAVQKPQTTTVQKRNERERNRVKLINRTFATLRDRLPTRYNGKKAKKLSKVEVLKTATTYIAYLVRLLESDSGEVGGFSFDQESPKKSSKQHTLKPALCPRSQTAEVVEPNGPLAADMCDLSDLLLSDDDDCTPREAAAAAAAGAATASGDIDDSGMFHLSACSETANSSSVSCSPTELHQQQQQQLQFPRGGFTEYFTMSTPVKPFLQEEHYIQQQQQQQHQQQVPAFYLVTASASAVDLGFGGQLDCSAASDVHFLSVSDGIGSTNYLQYL